MLIEVGEHVAVEPVRVPRKELHPDVMANSVHPLQGLVGAAGQTNNIKLLEVLLSLVANVGLIHRHKHIGVQLLCVGNRCKSSLESGRMEEKC